VGNAALAVLAFPEFRKCEMWEFSFLFFVLQGIEVSILDEKWYNHGNCDSCHLPCQTNNQTFRIHTSVSAEPTPIMTATLGIKHWALGLF
jgi:hypothetical protein